MHPSGRIWTSPGSAAPSSPTSTGCAALRPDLVLANAEENRAEDVAALRAAGIPVWVTAPATVDRRADSLGRMCAVLGEPEPAWLAEARAVVGRTADGRAAP